jgi:hypothetical protein
MRAASSTQLTITKVDYSIYEYYVRATQRRIRYSKYSNETDRDHNMYGLITVNESFDVTQSINT